jgi:hypothetical protein
MDTPHPTLNTFFSYANQALPGEQVEAIAQRKQLPCQGLVQEACGRVSELLDIRLEDIFTGAWNKLQSLQKYLDKDRYPPEKVVLAPLAEHAIKSQHRPYIEILVNEALVGKIEFQIDLVLKLQGFILKIQDGKITEAFTGTCAGKGTLACENFVMLEKETDAIPLPGSLKFGEGIPIPGPSQ